MKILPIDRSQNTDVYPKVLVVGMNRTGTSSIKQALETLYKKPVYHGSTVLTNSEHLNIWLDLAYGRISPENVDWKRLFKGYVAVTDVPSAYYFKAMIKAFPDAKVILSIRDEQEWLDSYCRLIQAGQRFLFMRFVPLLARLRLLTEQTHKVVFGKKVTSEDGVDRLAILEGYRKHNKKVKEHVDDEKLLKFNVKQGWQPLCNFLSKEIPETPFPLRNAGTKGPTKMIATALIRYYWLPIILLIFATGLITVCIVS